MIQIKRGSTVNWLERSEPLADGQPSFDKTNGKLKIGNGKNKWNELPYASGIFRDEVLASEEAAKTKQSALKAIYGPFYNIASANETPIITYGAAAPNSESTVGELYLQFYDSEPEVDYVVESCASGAWQYQKWYYGKARAWTSVDFTTNIDESFETISLFTNSTAFTAIDYPFTFTEIPVETATVHSTQPFVWLASTGANTAGKTGKYSLVSTDKVSNSSTYKISIMVEGFWRSPER